MIDYFLTEKIDRLLGQLTQSPLGLKVLFGINSPVAREQVIQYFGDQTAKLGYYSVDLTLSRYRSLTESIHEMLKKNSDHKLVISIKNLELFFKEYDEPIESAHFLDRNVPIFQTIPHTIILWIPTYIYDHIYQYAPNFFRYFNDRVHLRQSHEMPLAAEYALVATQPKQVRQVNIDVLEAEISKLGTGEYQDLKRASILESLALNYFENQDYEKAFESYEACILVGIANPLNEALYHNQLGIIYHIWGRFDKAREQYAIAFEKRERLDDKPGLADTHHYFGMLEQDLGNFNEAIQHYETSIDLNKKLDQPQKRAHSLLNLGTIYNALGNLNQAFQSFADSLSIYKKINFKSGIAVALTHIAMIQMEKQKYESALKNYLLSRSLGEKLNLTGLVHHIDHYIDGLKNHLGKEEFKNLRDNVKATIQRQEDADQKMNELGE